MRSLRADISQFGFSGSSSGGASNPIKSFHYVGNGENQNIINFPDTVSCILGIYGDGLTSDYKMQMLPIPNGINSGLCLYGYGTGGGIVSGTATWSGNMVTLEGFKDLGGLCNVSGVDYTIIYI